MPTKLTNLRIDEVSSVDRGAGEGVKVLLMKRKTDNATKALELALTSIFGSDQNVGKAVEVFRQFHEHLSKGDEPQEINMTEEQINKLVAEAVAKALEEAEKKKRPAKPENNNSVSGDTDGPDATGGGDSAAGDTGKRLSDEEAKKLLTALGIELPAVEKKDEKADEIAKRDAEIVDLRKHIAALNERQQKEDFAKKAVSIGLTAPEGEHLRKAYQGDVASLKFLEDTIAKLHTQVEKAGLFNEIGDAQGGRAATAHDELMAKAAEVRKGNPKLTQAQAYVQAMEIYPEIAKREREESHAKIQKSAQ